MVRFDHEDLDAASDVTVEREWRTPDDVMFGTLTGDMRPLAAVDEMSERGKLLREFPPGDGCPVRGVLCLADLRAMGDPSAAG